MTATPPVPSRRPELLYEFDETRKLVDLVNAAAERIRISGESAFGELSTDGSRWQDGETYIFVLDTEGNMLVHPDSSLQGRNVLDLKDVHGKPIILGLIAAATAVPGTEEGWYHYEWPVPGGLFPRWKSAYVRAASAPSGKRYVVGSGIYSDLMERAFVIEMVSNAGALIEQSGESAFAQLRNPTGPYIAKDAYVFVLDMNGVALVHPAFPNLEGTNLHTVRDMQGRYLVREMLELLRTEDSGWVTYMWPKPGESVPTQKSTYVRKARMGNQTLIVACGVYLAGAHKEHPTAQKMTALELMALVREGAALLETQGQNGYTQFRNRGSSWFNDEVYFFAWTMEGTKVFHAADPASEGQNVRGLTDIVGRPIGRMILDVAASTAGEGWVHYMYPEPGSLFPTWKSTFVKRVVFPDGTSHILGCGIYNMQLDKTFIEDVVNRAVTLVEGRGREAFDQLRDRTGPFVFMDTYVFVQSPDGTELVNAALPSLEGRNIMDLRDAHGKAVIREQIATVMQEGCAWLEFYWYHPGDNTPARKLTYARKVQAGNETLIVGSGIYME